jgi:hypothetical protein
MHNKSLQLSPQRPPVTVDAVLSIQQGAADAAGQLNSMLGGMDIQKGDGDEQRTGAT